MKDKFYLNIVYHFKDDPQTVKHLTVKAATISDCWNKIESKLLSLTQIESALYFDLVKIKRVHIQPIRGAK
jgi:hypothetical protein